MKKVFLIFAASLFFLAACKSSDDSTEVTIKNETDRAITFTYFSSDIDVPVTIASGDSKTFSYTKHVEGLDFDLTYNDSSYSGTTNYVQDYAEYSVRIFLEDGTLKSKTTGKSALSLDLK